VWASVDWIHLAQVRDQWRDLVNTVNETWGSIKGWECLDEISEYVFLKDSTPWS
jgi:hypothetical protein